MTEPRELYACIHGSQWVSPWAAAECDCDLYEDLDLERH